MPSGIKLLLVAEGHRLKRQDRFARLVHRLDLFLETLGGSDRAEVTVGIDNYSYASCNGRPADASDKGVAVCVPFLPMRMVLASPQRQVADIDVVAPGGEIRAGGTPKAMLLLPVVL